MKNEKTKNASEPWPSDAIVASVRESSELRDLRDKVRNLRGDLEFAEHARQRDGELIKMLEGSRSDLEYSLAEHRYQATKSAAEYKALERRLAEVSERAMSLERSVEVMRDDFVNASIALRVPVFRLAYSRFPMTRERRRYVADMVRRVADSLEHESKRSVS